MVAKWWQKWYPFTGLLLAWLGEEVPVGGNWSGRIRLPAAV